MDYMEEYIEPKDHNLYIVVFYDDKGKKYETVPVGDPYEVGNYGLESLQQTIDNTMKLSKKSKRTPTYVRYEIIKL